MSQFPNSQPGIGTALTVTPRILFIMDTASGDFLPQGSCIDGYNARDPGNTDGSFELRPGLVLGKIVHTGGSFSHLPVIGQYGASIIGTLTSAITNATTQTSLVTTYASCVEVTRRLGSSGTLVLTGAPTATGTVATQSVAYSAVTLGTTTGTITVTAPQTAFTAGTWIGAWDGSNVPTTILCGDLYVVRVTDANGTSMANVPLRYIPITNKPYKTSNIVDYPAAANTTLTAYLKTKIRVPVPGAAFSDDF